MEKGEGRDRLSPETEKWTRPSLFQVPIVREMGLYSDTLRWAKKERDKHINLSCLSFHSYFLMILKASFFLWYSKKARQYHQLISQVLQKRVKYQVLDETRLLLIWVHPLVSKDLTCSPASNQKLRETNKIRVGQK